MKRLLVLLLFFAHSLFCIEVDFDVVIVGSSPISLLEALYHHYTGKKVLILEAESECGGAWKSIGICGLYPVDLGCHTLGQDKQILQFLEEYVGCKMVSIDNPLQPFQLANSPNGFYPKGGCYEIVHNLLYLIKKTEITLLVNHKLESVFVHPDNTLAEITTQGMRLTTSKIVVTPHSDINVENSTSSKLSKPSTRFHHIYMLIEDVEKLCFSSQQPLFYTTQTTLSLDDVQAIVNALTKKYPHVETLPSSSICYATTNRQMALREITDQADLILVVGDPSSSNSNRLREVAQLRGVAAYLINTEDEIDPQWLNQVQVIGMTAGASTPENIVQRCIQKLKMLGVNSVEEVVFTTEDIVFQLPQSVLSPALS